MIPRSPARLGSRYAWFIVALLWVVALLNYLDRQVIFSILPLLRADMKLSAFQLGLLSTVFLWVYGALSPFGGYLADRFGARRVILFGLFTWSLTTWATGLSRNYSELLLARGAMGMSEACYLPAGLALIASVHGRRTRSLATGVHFSGLYFGLIIGGAGGAWVAERHGWRSVFVILGIVGVVYSIFFKYALRPDADTKQSDTSPMPSISSALAQLLRLPAFGILCVVFAGMAIANWLVFTWLPLFLFERYRMSLPEAGFVATFYSQVGCLIGMVAGGWLADRWSQKSVWARIATQILSLAAAAPALFLVGRAGSLVVVITSLMIFGMGRAAYDCNIMPSLCQIAPEQLRATGYGIFNCLGCIAGGVMAAVAGWMKTNFGLGYSFYVAAAILLGSALLLTLLPAFPSKLMPVNGPSDILDPMISPARCVSELQS
jgi:predicted MFS family arabinose efflux permease